MIRLALILVFLIPVLLRGATINSPTASYVDVSNSIYSAVDGDSVTIPAGRAEWTNQMIISKAIWLTGLNITTNAIITSAVLDGTPLMIWNLVSNMPSRMSYIEFTNGSVAKTYGQAIQVNGVD